MEFFPIDPREKLVLTPDGKLRMRGARSNHRRNRRDADILLSLYVLVQTTGMYKYDALVARTYVPRSMFSNEQKQLFQTMADIVATKLNRDYARLNKTANVSTKEK